MYGGTNDPSRHDDEVVFPDAEERVWSYDEQAGQYYLHHFYNHQPDLNLKNPRVRDEIAKLIAFWLQMGGSGFRVDPVPYLLINDPSVEEQGNPHE